MYVPLEFFALDLSALNSLLGSKRQDIVDKIQLDIETLNTSEANDLKDAVLELVMSGTTKSDEIANALLYLTTYVTPCIPLPFLVIEYKNWEITKEEVKRQGLQFSFPKSSQYSNLIKIKSDNVLILTSEHLDALRTVMVRKKKTYEYSCLHSATKLFVNAISHPNVLYAKQLTKYPLKPAKLATIPVRRSVNRPVKKKTGVLNIWENIPVEIQNEIFAFLTIKTLTKLMCINKKFKLAMMTRLNEYKKNIGIICLINAFLFVEE